MELNGLLFHGLHMHQTVKQPFKPERIASTESIFCFYCYPLPEAGEHVRLKFGLVE